MLIVLVVFASVFLIAVLGLLAPSQPGARERKQAMARLAGTVLPRWLFERAREVR